MFKIRYKNIYIISYAGVFRRRSVFSLFMSGKKQKKHKKHKKRKKSSVEVDNDIESWLDFGFGFGLGCVRLMVVDYDGEIINYNTRER